MNRGQRDEDVDSYQAGTVKRLLGIQVYTVKII